MNKLIAVSIGYKYKPVSDHSVSKSWFTPSGTAVQLPWFTRKEAIIKEAEDSLDYADQAFYIGQLWQDLGLHEAGMEAESGMNHRIFRAIQATPMQRAVAYLKLRGLYA